MVFCLFCSNSKSRTPSLSLSYPVPQISRLQKSQRHANRRCWWYVYFPFNFRN